MIVLIYKIRISTKNYYEFWVAKNILQIPAWVW